MPEYSRKDLDSFIRSIHSPPKFEGRGIVISAGGHYIHLAYVAVKSLRLQGCGLPIQIWHRGVEEFPENFKERFAPLDVEFVNSFDYLEQYPMPNLGGWQNKVYSIAWCRFNEVLSFEADNFAIQNPEFLFSEGPFLKTGNLFWPDFENVDTVASIKPYAWEFLGLAAMKNAELESGQLLLDKTRCWKPLQVALHMNAHSDFYYRHCTWGDKDTYRLAFAYLEEAIAVVQHRPNFISKEYEIRIQHGPNGTPLFQHGRKWLVPLQLNRYIKGYAMEDEVLEWLQEFLGPVF